MPLQAEEIQLAQEFNRTLLDVVNCELVKPPYLAGRVPYQFFLKKRRALDRTLDFGLDEVYDLYKSGNDFYAYGKSGSNLYVRKNDSSTTIMQLSAAASGYTYKFVFPRMPVGAIYDSGVSSAVVAETTTLTDGTKAWGANTLAGKYVYAYVQNAAGVGVGAGQWALIASNTGTVITLSGAWAGSGVLSVKYRIYDTAEFALGVTHQDGVYVVHKESGTALTKTGTVYSNASWTDGIAGTDVTLLRSLGAVVDAAYKDGRWYLAQPAATGRPNPVWVSPYTDGGAAIPSGIASTIGSVSNFCNVYQFQEYVVFASLDQLNIVKETVTQDSTGTAYFSYSLNPLTKNFGQFGPGAYEVWNQSLYMVTNQKRFVSVGIVPVYGSQYKIEIQQQGVYVQGLLDQFTSTDSVRITIDENDIWIVRKPTAGDSWILRYDIAYKGWHRWTTGTRAYRVWNGDLGSPRFLAAGAFQLSGGIGYSDRLGVGGTTYAFDQSIKAVVGDARPRSFKNINAVCFTIGPTTTRGATVNATSRFGGIVGTSSATLQTVQYLLDLLNVSGNPGQGGNLLGPWQYPPGTLQATLSSDIGDCSVVEWHVAHHAVFSILEWKGLGAEAIEFGGATVSYEEGSPLVVDPYNVITQ